MISKAPRFSEDIPQLAAESFHLADRLCRSCGEVHAVWPYIRLARATTGTEPDDSALQALLSDFVKGGRRQILIAGAADTGILALLARAAAGCNAEIVVVDRCQTPLELCRSFARRWSLAIETICLDLADLDMAERFDVVVVHGTLQFIAADRRPRVVSRLARSLRGDGRLALLFNTSQPVAAELVEAHRRDYADHVMEELDRLNVPLPEGRAEFNARLRAHARQRESREGAFLHPEDVSALLDSAGLAIEFHRPIKPTMTPSTQRLISQISKRRHLAVARPARQS